MKNIQNFIELGSKKTLKLGALLLSTLLIVGASIFVYTRVVYERALNVGGAGTMSPAVNPAPETLLVLVVLAFVISLSMFGFLREFSKRKNKVPTAERLPRVPGPDPQKGEAATDIVLPLQLPPILREWEEAPKNEDDQT